MGQEHVETQRNDTTIIIGDSIFKGLRNDLLSRAKKPRVTVRSFPGASSSDMKHYLDPSLHLEPREIILHAGTNDLRDSSPRTVAEKLVDVGNLVSSSSPNAKVTISALTQRFDEESHGRKVTECNKIIKSFCNQNGWGLVQHQNIDLSCVNGHKLHFNRKGIAILASNFVNYLTNWCTVQSLSEVDANLASSDNDVSENQHPMIVPKDRGFKMACLNINSLTKHIDELRVVLRINVLIF